MISQSLISRVRLGSRISGHPGLFLFRLRVHTLDDEHCPKLRMNEVGAHVQVLVIIRVCSRPNEKFPSTVFMIHLHFCPIDLPRKAAVRLTNHLNLLKLEE